MADSYATVEQLQAQWRYLSPVEQGIAAELLEQASAMVRKAYIDARRDPDMLDTDDLLICRAVVCDMVRYSMLNGSMGNTMLVGDNYEGAMVSDMEGGGVTLNEQHYRMLGLRGSAAGFFGAHRG